MADRINTVEGKKVLVEAIVRRVKEEVLADVEKLPDDWNGHHLRVMLAEAFRQETNFNGCNRARRQIKNSAVKYELSGYYG